MNSKDDEDMSSDIDRQLFDVESCDDASGSQEDNKIRPTRSTPRLQELDQSDSISNNKCSEASSVWHVGSDCNEITESDEIAESNKVTTKETIAASDKVATKERVAVSDKVTTKSTVASSDQITKETVTVSGKVATKRAISTSVLSKYKAKEIPVSSQHKAKETAVSNMYKSKKTSMLSKHKAKETAVSSKYKAKETAVLSKRKTRKAKKTAISSEHKAIKRGVAIQSVCNYCGEVFSKSASLKTHTCACMTAFNQTVDRVLPCQLFENMATLAKQSLIECENRVTSAESSLAEFENRVFCVESKKREFGCGACGEVYGSDEQQAKLCFHLHTGCVITLHTPRLS